MMKMRASAPLLSRILIISIIMLIIAFAGLLVLLERSCGGDNKPERDTYALVNFL